MTGIQIRVRWRLKWQLRHKFKADIQDQYIYSLLSSGALANYFSLVWFSLASRKMDNIHIVFSHIRSFLEKSPAAKYCNDIENLTKVFKILDDLLLYCNLSISFFRSTSSTLLLARHCFLCCVFFLVFLQVSLPAWLVLPILLLRLWKHSKARTGRKSRRGLFTGRYTAL